MRSISLILLAVILLTAFSPLSALTFPASADGGPVLGMLDVCRQASPAVSSQGLMPCISEVPFVHQPVLASACTVCSIQLFSQFLLASRQERPPQA